MEIEFYTSNENILLQHHMVNESVRDGFYDTAKIMIDLYAMLADPEGIAEYRKWGYGIVCMSDQYYAINQIQTNFPALTGAIAIGFPKYGRHKYCTFDGITRFPHELALKFSILDHRVVVDFNPNTVFLFTQYTYSNLEKMFASVKHLYEKTRKQLSKKTTL